MRDRAIFCLRSGSASTPSATATSNSQETHGLPAALDRLGYLDAYPLSPNTQRSPASAGSPPFCAWVTPALASSMGAGSRRTAVQHAQRFPETSLLRVG